jgi:hypothetical protein
MRRSNAESPDTFTAKPGFFDRTLAPHTDRLGVSCRVRPMHVSKKPTSVDERKGDFASTETGSIGYPELENLSFSKPRISGVSTAL